MKNYLIIAVPLILALFTDAKLDNICATKQEWGFQCDGCSKVVKCYKSSNNWFQIDVDECESKQLFCSKAEGKCSTKKDCEDDYTIPNINFVCNSEGIFPNPFDCKTYYVCETAGAKSNKISCPDGYAFNPEFSRCNKKSTDIELCRKKQYECNTENYMSAWPTNNNIYYICKYETDLTTKEKTMYPELNTCEPDYIFDNQDQKCKSMDDIPFTTTDTNEIQSTTVNTTTVLPPINICIKPGIFEDPNNCRGYIYCTLKLDKIFKVCPNNSHFDKITKSCVLGNEC